MLPTNTACTDVMKRIAAPLIGGMITAPLLSLLVIPTLYLWWHERQMGRTATPANRN